MSSVAGMMALTGTLGGGGNTAPPVFQEFTSTGSTTYTIPANVNTLRVRAWGSGGAGSDYAGTSYGPNVGSTAGGSGGFAEAYVDVSGQTSITVIVATGTSGGQGAATGGDTAGTGIGTGGEGTGGGDGGAGSGIKFGNTMVLVAGGGGGSSAGTWSGGGGGGTSGGDGSGTSATYEAGGGSGSTGGSGSGTGGDSGGNAGSGTNGGGNGGGAGGGSGGAGGGGGGGGYAGGGGGDGGNVTPESSGGGGSGYANSTYCTNITLTTGGVGTAVPQSSLLPTGGTGTYASGGYYSTSTATDGTALVQGKQGCVIIDNNNGAIV